MAELVDALKNEMLWVLFALRTIERRTNQQVDAGKSRLDLAEDLFMLEALSQQVVLRLCRLDDDQNKSKWFRRIPKEMEARHESQERIRGANTLIKEYRDQINHLKNAHRNTYIGHLHETESATPKVPLLPPGLKEATNAALAIVDFLEGKCVEYSFRPATDVPTLLLRPCRGG